tara:strand:+ start:386992 stop:387888 length:897 start_codon:yes stop_codon:yes gene_type:complete
MSIFGASNVVVYDHNNLELYTDLNSLDPVLGKHELALVKKDALEALKNNNPSYGDIFWQPGYAFELEAFSANNTCVSAYNSNTSACLNADNNVSCLVTDGNTNECSCYTYKQSTEDRCGYVDLSQKVLATPYRVSAKGSYYDAQDSVRFGLSFGTLTFNQSPYIFSQMMNASSNANEWVNDCALLAKGVNQLGYGAYCYTQTGALGFGFQSQQYFFQCSGSGCYHPEMTGNTTVCGAATCTLWGELLEGAAEEVELALRNFTVESGGENDYEGDQDLTEAELEALNALAEVAGAIVGG